MYTLNFQVCTYHWTGSECAGHSGLDNMNGADTTSCLGGDLSGTQKGICGMNKKAGDPCNFHPGIGSECSREGVEKYSAGVEMSYG